MTAEFPLDPDDFAAYFSYSPAALALRECIRLRAVREIDLPEPILDVGCGDGLFARLAYPKRDTWGIDINASEVRRAQASSSYRTLICGSICDVGLPESFFGSAVANCSLEHVPDLDAALRNIRKSLKPGAPFVLIVPTPDWTTHLMIPEALERVGLGAVGRAYGAGLDKVFAHHHLYDQGAWAERLRNAGFGPTETRTIVHRKASWTFDALLYPSLLGYFTKKLTGRWVLAPALRALTERTARAMADAIGSMAPAGEGAGEYLLITHAVEPDPVAGAAGR